MFREIAEELIRAGARENLLAMAPAYVYHACKESNIYVDGCVNDLLDLLEKKRVFMEQTDGYLHLFLEYGVPEYGGRATYGFSNMSGKFQRTLEQWISFIGRQHQVRQGIILIRIEWTKELLIESVWWNAFFRHLHWFKEDFLFVFLIEGNEADKGMELLEKGCFCRRKEIRKKLAEEYQAHFLELISEEGFSLSVQGKALLMDILKKHEEEMSGYILLRWTRELIWEHLVSDVPKESRKEIIPDACLSEEGLEMCIRREKSVLKIGFE